MSTADQTNSPAERHEQLEMLSRTLVRETHILAREPELLASHLHNTLYLEEGEEGPAGPLLTRAHEALTGRPWLRLVNRPRLMPGRSALLRVMEHGGRCRRPGLVAGRQHPRLGGGPDRPPVGPRHGDSRGCPGEGHAGKVNALAWSPDGALLASGSKDNTVRLWDPATGTPRAVLKGHSDSVTAVAWSPDGALVASGSKDNTVRLWDPATGEPGAVLEGHTVHVCALAWSPEGATLASTGSDGTVRLWDAERGSERAVVERLAYFVYALAFSPDGRTIAWGGLHRTVHLWDVDQAKDRVILWGHTGSVHALAFSPDGRAIVSGGDTTARIWDVERATEQYERYIDDIDVTPLGHTNRIRAVSFSADGATLASGDWEDAGEDISVLLWDTERGTRRELWGPMDGVFALAFSPDGSTLASADLASVDLWDVEERVSRARLPGDFDWGPLALAWSPAGDPLAWGGVDGTVRLWDPATGKALAVLEPQMASTTTLHLISAALTTQQGTIHLLRAAYGLAWSPDGAILASGSRDRIVRLWDCYAGEGGAVLRGHTDDINAVVWSANGALLASGSRDNTVRLWDPASGTCLAMAHCLSPILALQFSAEGRILRAADDGAATGNRPLPYLFELRNIEIGPPVQRRGIEAVPAEKEAAKPEEAPLERPGREKPRPKPLPRPSREEQRAAARSLGDLLDATGLRYSGSGDSLAVPFQSERADQLVVHARKLRDDLAYLAVTLPQPGWLGQEKALHNLLQVSFDANYAKALALGSGELAFAVELPVELLTPEMVEGVVRGLSHLGDVKKGDLANWEGWQRRLRECTLAQAASFQVDVQQAEETIPSLAQAAGLSCREVERGVYLMDWEVAGLRVGLVARVREPVISFILSLGGVKPKGDRKRYLRRLLELNRATNVAKVGLDSDGDVALLYEVPQVLPELLDKARAQLQLLLLGVIALEAGK